MKLAPRHRAAIADLLGRVSEFTADEVAVALELVDEGLARGDASGYRFAVDEAADGSLRGYACFGPTPMTEATWDLYWIAVDPRLQRGGHGRALLGEVERAVAAATGRLLRVETASLDAYDATRAFYERAGYACAARLGDFYARGNDLCIYTKYLDRPAADV